MESLFYKLGLGFLFIGVFLQNSLFAAAGDYIPATTIADIGDVKTDAQTVGGSVIGLVLALAAVGIIIYLVKKR